MSISRPSSASLEDAVLERTEPHVMKRNLHFSVTTPTFALELKKLDHFKVFFFFCLVTNNLGPFEERNDAVRSAVTQSWRSLHLAHFLWTVFFGCLCTVWSVNKLNLTVGYFVFHLVLYNMSVVNLIMFFSYVVSLTYFAKCL